MCGAAARAPWPRSAASASVGTTRQPTSAWPSSAQIAATIALQRSRSAASVGKNTTPAANLPGAGNVTAKLSLRDPRQKLVGQRRDHAGAVAGVRLGAARAAMIHAAQEVIGVLDDLVAALAFDVRDEAHAAAVVLELGPIQPLRRREAGAVWFTHACRPHAARAPTTQRSARARLGVPARCSFVLVALAVMVLYSGQPSGSAGSFFLAWLAVAMQDLSSRRPFDLPRRGPKFKRTGAGLVPTSDYREGADARVKCAWRDGVSRTASGSPCRRRFGWRRTSGRRSRTWPGFA